MQSDYVIFDVETAPMDQATIFAQAEPFQPDSVKLGNVKDPQLRKAKIDEAHNNYYANIIDKAALDARTGTVLCVGFYYPDTIKCSEWPNKSEFGLLEGEEKQILTNLWLHITYPGKYVGFNILNFDLPFLCRRCWHHGIPVPAWVFDGRYFHRNFVDLMTYWQMGNRQDFISLDKFARFVGLEGKQRNGKEFHSLYASDREEALKYVRHDLRLTAEIAKRLQV